jgi:protein SCO1/2
MELDDNAVAKLCRRGWLGAALGVGLGAALGALWAARMRPADRQAPLLIPYHGGRVDPPLPLPDIALELADGTRSGLRRLLGGKLTAVHVMFTGCSTICPIQGMVFQRLQELLPARTHPEVQLLSLSISPMEDTPQSLRAWLARYQLQPGWIAASPDPVALDTVQDLFGGGRGGLADHATEVSIVNRRAELVWRTYELPSPESLADILGRS